MTARPRIAALQAHFVGWQCRVRAAAMRRFEGRPTPAMRPRVLTPAGDAHAPAVTTLLMRRDPAAAAAEFRHLTRRTHDPRARREAALALLAERYYQPAHEFGDLLTASFAADSPLAAALADAATCRLAFAQDGQRYDLPCAVARLRPDDAHWQATYWHNALFNHSLPPDIQVLSLAPRWLDASADPAPDARVPNGRRGGRQVSV